MTVTPDQRRTFAERLAENDAAEPGYAATWGKLCEKLLALGGETVVVTPWPHPVQDVQFIADHSRRFDPVGAVFEPGETGECHDNAEKLWRAGDGMATGFALSADGLWREHSWGVRAGCVVETTVERADYFGVERVPRS